MVVTWIRAWIKKNLTISYYIDCYNLFGVVFKFDSIKSPNWKLIFVPLIRNKIVIRVWAFASPVLFLLFKIYIHIYTYIYTYYIYIIHIYIYALYIYSLINSSLRSEHSTHIFSSRFHFVFKNQYPVYKTVIL